MLSCTAFGLARTGRLLLVAMVDWVPGNGSFWLLVSYFRQVWHVAIISFISLDIPGQNMVSLALRRHDSTPRCDAWSFCFMSRRRLEGITIRCPRNMTPSWMDSSSLILKYGVTWAGVWPRSSGHPRRITSLRAHRVSSLSVACWISRTVWTVESLELETGRKAATLMCSNSTPVCGSW